MSDQEIARDYFKPMSNQSKKHPKMEIIEENLESSQSIKRLMPAPQSYRVNNENIFITNND